MILHFDAVASFQVLHAALEGTNSRGSTEAELGPHGEDVRQQRLDSVCAVLTSTAQYFVESNATSGTDTAKRDECWQAFAQVIKAMPSSERLRFFEIVILLAACRVHDCFQFET